MLNTAFHPGKLERIFISHLHGDHVFGLPGLLCSRSMAGNPHPLTVYGPKGVREFIETTLRLSGSWTDFPLHIEEISEGRSLTMACIKSLHSGWRIHWSATDIALLNMTNLVR